jgi:hypothetical protein
MLNTKIILAGMFIAGLFFVSCGGNEEKEPEPKKPVQLETVKLDTMPFDCKTDSLIPLGFINHDWVYENKKLGIRFVFPKGWNAIEDFSNTNPIIVPVGGDLTEFRDRYTHPQSLKLSLMIGNAWNEKRYLFGITQTAPKHVMDEEPLDLSGKPLAAAEIFYSDEYASEQALYKEVIGLTMEEWEKNGYDRLVDINKATIKTVKPVQIGNSTFYSNSIKFPDEKGTVTSTTMIKKLGCLFLVISLNSNTEKEKAYILQALSELNVRS